MSLLAGPSGTSPYTSIGNSLPPNSSLKPHFASTGYPSSNSYDSIHASRSEGNPSPLGSNGVSQVPQQQDSLPFFKKTSKTLFPQQHGGSQGSISPSSESNTNVNNAQTGTPSLLGTKRKLEPLSESDSLHTGGGPTGANGDYFSGPIAAVEVMRNDSTTPRALPQYPAGDHTHAMDMQAMNAAKRRASQPFIKAANLGKNNDGGGVSELLPTPVSMVSGSGTGASQSASSSERRSSNGSSHDAIANNMTNANGNVPTHELPEEAKYNTRKTARYAIGDMSNQSEEVTEVDSRNGYAFPTTQRPPPLHLDSGSRVSPSLESTYYDNQISTSPYTNRGYQPPSSIPNQNTPSYGPASVQTRLPSNGTLPVDLRSKASSVFGATNGRPSYTSNGNPVLSEQNGGPGGNNNLITDASGMSSRVAPGGPGGMGSMYNGPTSSMKEATLHHNALLQIQQQELQEQQGGGGSISGGNQPYARSPALKVSHKIAERKRRKEMKELFDELRDSIPSMTVSTTIVEGIDSNGNPIAIAAPPPPPPADVGGRGIKSSKWEVLAKAVEYINKLQFENSELSNSVIELQRLNQAFQDELAMVRSGGGGNSAIGVGHGNSSTLGMEGMNGLGGPSGAGVARVVHYQQQQENNQLYPHQQQLQQPQHQQQHQQAPVSNYHGTSADPSPSPVSVHAMPPLTHHSHSMPAAIGGTGSGTHSPHPATLSVHHSPIQPQVYPISAPPHMASHSFFSPNESQNQQFQFAQPIPRSLHQQHSRNVSLNSNNGGSSVGNGHFEHAGSAPPALQHHPHQSQHQHQQQSSMGGGSNQGSPLGQHQNVQIFSHQPSSLSNDMQQQQQPSYAHQQHQGRPGSMRSHHSSQSVLSNGHSQSPQPVHGAMHQHQQQQHHETWVGSPYQQQHQPIRGSTIPPGSSQGTPLMSPMNPTY